MLPIVEIKRMSVYGYNAVNDKMLGSHNHVTVVIVRPLFYTWNQPIFVHFEKNGKKCLDNIIKRLHIIGFNVVAIVSDGGGGIICVWKEYVSHDHSYLFLKNNKKEYWLTFRIS